ncbi:hypothetical protein BZG20_10035 [Salinivibrio sp. IB868]|nr:hypothetical protein BZG20_10035 [Salinivibrio sp. IB868]OOE76172.1 hypothetical protein BZG22_04475 [Salinivibrio sp. IB870]
MCRALEHTKASENKMLLVCATRRAGFICVQQKHIRTPKIIESRNERKWGERRRRKELRAQCTTTRQHTIDCFQPLDNYIPKSQTLQR